MMNYEMFREVVAEQFLSYVPDDFANYKVEVHSVVKVNQKDDELMLIPPDSDGRQVTPAISIKTMYHDYKKNGDLKNALESGATDLVDAYRNTPKDAYRMIIENAKDRVVMTLVNTEQNKELLKTVPNREFCDLSIVYRIVTGIGINGVQSLIVSNELSKNIGMDEQSLYSAAVENTKRMFPPVTRSMNEVIRSILTQDGMPKDMAESMIGEMSEDKMMYVISNDKSFYGAVSMLYENELHTLAEHLGKDLYILPSSTSEVIAVPADVGNPNILAQMVAEINMSQLELKDRLSNQVYHYDKDLRRLTMATDTPNKRLDGIAAEQQMSYETKQSR